nr:hypothetical protein [Tanacetum cinerariifolium]
MSLFHQRGCHGCGQPCDGYYCDSCTCTRRGMTLFNGTCDNCIYGNEKPIICTACGSRVKGGLCLPYDFREKNLYNCDPNAYSFYNSNYLPRPQYKNYLCNLCGNNSNDGYACQQQFSFVYEQEPSYNQNYDDLKELVEYDNSPSRDRPIFFNNDEIHSDQNKESLENTSKEIVVSNPNEEKEEPPQDSDIHQLIEECSTEVCEEQKQSMKDTMLELVKICQEKEFLCIHDNVDDLIESALNTKLISINSIDSQRHDKKEQEVKNVVEQPAQLATIISTKEPEHLLSMGYEHLSITPETESDDVIESNAKNLLPITSECEVTLEDKRNCDVPISKNSTVCDNHSDIFSDSKNDDDISVYDDFEDIEYVEASLSDPEIVNVEEENVVYQEEEEERLINVLKSDISDDSSNDSLLEEADLFLASDNSIPSGIENIANDSKGDIRFLEELLIDDSILSHESSDSNFEDNPSVPRPPPKPSDAETDAGKEIPVVMNNKDKFDEDYYFFMFDKVFTFLSAESEDTIFDPVYVETIHMMVMIVNNSFRLSMNRNQVTIKTMMYSKPENPNELFQKLLEDLKELAEYDNSPSRDRPIFFNNDENHSDKNKESLENTSKEIAVSNPNEENEEPPQDSDIHQLIEECSTEVCEEQKQSMEDTMLELVKFVKKKSFFVYMIICHKFDSWKNLTSHLPRACLMLALVGFHLH